MVTVILEWQLHAAAHIPSLLNKVKIPILNHFLSKCARLGVVRVPPCGLQVELRLLYCRRLLRVGGSLIKAMLRLVQGFLLQGLTHSSVPECLLVLRSSVLLCCGSK